MIRRIQNTGIVLAILVLAGCAAKEPQQPATLTGAWRCSIQFESGAFAAVKDLEFMYVFNAGGTLTESSNYDGAPPVPPAYGVWRSVAPLEFEARYEYYATAPSEPEAFKKGAGWLPSGRGVFTERIQLSEDGRSYTSTIRYEAFSANGEPADSGGEASGRGARIQF